MRQKKNYLKTFQIFGLILAIAAFCLFLIGNRSSQLAAYFIYMLVTCTIIPLPTPPYVIGMGKVFHPVIVALVGAFGNCISAFIEYHFIKWLFSKTQLRQKVEENSFYQRFSYFFSRTAFICLIFTGFSPIPFEPFRLAAILTRYNMSKYLLAIFIGRFPRFYLIALIGDTYKIPNLYLIVMFILLFIIPVISSCINKIFKIKRNKKDKNDNCNNNITERSN